MKFLKFGLYLIVQFASGLIMYWLLWKLLLWDHLRSDGDYYFSLWAAGGTEMIYFIGYSVMVFPSLLMVPDINWMKVAAKILGSCFIGYLGFSILQATWALAFDFLSTFRSALELLCKVGSLIGSLIFLWTSDF